MQKFWSMTYSFVFLPLLWLGFRTLWLFNAKVRRGVRGRATSMMRLRVFLRNRPETEERLWIHASSMGEFEQAKPIIEALKLRHPELIVIASFFSPSGYENSRRYKYIDALVYIPFDSRRRAREFLELARPTAAAFIRYDVWPNHIWQARELGIPVILTNATLRATSPRLYPILRSFHRTLFGPMQSILTVSESDAESFRQLKLKDTEILAIGDTRYDRVAGKAAESYKKQLIPEKITAGKKLVVAGSSWSEDEEVLLPVMFKLLGLDPDILFIIVPHEPTLEHLELLEYNIGAQAQTLRFSYLQTWKDERVLLVDSIGILLPLYACAQVAFVGGGFKSNVHNTLEPAAHGIPVLYGPKIQNSNEARELVDAGGGFIVQNKQELFKVLRPLLENDEYRSEVGQQAERFVNERAGSTEIILEHILAYLTPLDLASSQ